MAIVYTYPQTIDLQNNDLFVLSKMDEDGRPTRSISAANLANYLVPIISPIVGGSYLPLTAGLSFPLTGDLYMAPNGVGPSVGSKNIVFRGIDDLGTELDGGKIFTQDSTIAPSGQDLVFNNADDNGVLQTNLFINAFGLVGVGKTNPNYGLDVANDMNVDGNVTFSGYGSGTKTGTATYSLAVTATGFVVEQPLPVILINGLVNNLASAGSGGYDFMEWVSNVTSSTQIPVMKTPRDITLKSVSYSWMGNTPLSIAVGEQIAFTIGTIPSGSNPIIANYTSAVSLFDLTNADDGTYANDVVDGFSQAFSSGDVIAVVGQETGAITPNTGELSITLEFEM